jgi:phosphohistidine phosphatase
VAATKVKQNKQLVLLRHAKSNWDDPLLADFDRPLAKRGRKAGQRLAAWLKKQRIRPDAVLCSPSVRTRETLALIADAIGDQVPVAYDKGLYLAEAEDLLMRLRHVDSAAKCVMVIGHNPGMQELALALLRPGAKKSHAKLAEKFPTAAAACFDLPISAWSELQLADGTLTKFVKPADIDD